MVALNKSMNLAQQTDEPALVAHAFANRANVWLDVPDLTKAQSDMTAALDIYARIGNIDGQRTLLGNLGVLHRRRGAMGTALEYLERGLEMAWQQFNPEGVAYLLVNKGHIHFARGEHHEADECFESVHEVLRRLGHPAMWAIAESGHSSVRRALGDNVGALRHAERAVSRAARVSDPYARCRAAIARAEARGSNRDIAGAVTDLERCMDIAEAASSTLWTGVSATVMSDLLRGQEASLGWAEQAVEALEEAGEPIELAYAWLALARARSVTDPDGATLALERGRALVEQMDLETPSPLFLEIEALKASFNEI